MIHICAKLTNNNLFERVTELWEKTAIKAIYHCKWDMQRKAKCLSVIRAITVDGTQAVPLVTEPLLHMDKQLFSPWQPGNFQATPWFLFCTGTHAFLISISVESLKHLSGWQHRAQTAKSQTLMIGAVRTDPKQRGDAAFQRTA